MNKKNITLMVVAIATLITFIGLAIYAYFVGNINAGNTSNVTTTLNGQTSYWFDESRTTYTFPDYGGTLQTSGTATGHNVYIRQDDTKYYVCATIQGKEVCLSQPYTQYGLEGHTLGSYFNEKEVGDAAKAAIGEVFSDAGITGYSCTSYAVYAYCYVGDFYCGVTSNGYVDCSDGGAHEGCRVRADGSAYCSSSSGGN